MPGACFEEQLNESLSVLQSLREQTSAIEQVIALISAAMLRGQTIFSCGNGGSATDALHLAEELVGRYRSNRRPLPGVCLGADAPALTCIGNDFGFEQIFARQLLALARPGDVLVCFSTSGASPNILAALHAAAEREVTRIALLGKDGGAARALADHAIVVASHNSARIQEAHTFLLHTICEKIEQSFTG